MDVVTRELEEEGVKAFADAFTALLETVEQRRQTIVSRLGALAQPLRERVDALAAQHLPRRIWEHDPSVWTDDPAGQAEIRIRLGWLSLPETSRAALPEIEKFAQETSRRWFYPLPLAGHGRLLARAGSHVAGVRCSACFLQHSGFDRPGPGGRDGGALPAGENAVHRLLQIRRHGGSQRHVRLLLGAVAEAFGAQAGQRFVAITGPGTSLEKLAQERGFRHVFTADPNVGGRYSALAHLALVLPR